MNAWKNTTLGEILNLKRGYDLPNKDRANGNIPIFSSSGISGFHDKPMSSGPGVVTGRYGTIGQVFFASEPYWPLNTTLYVQDFKGNDPKFVYYFLKQLDWEKYSDKSAVPGVNRNDVHKELISFPTDLDEQESIATVLSSLDDKIDLLHRQNKTLEAMAETLFRRWFVEEAQEDWDIGKVEDLFVLQRGFDLPVQNRTTGKYPIFASSGLSGYHSEYRVSAPGITTGRSGILGNVFLVLEDFWPLNTSLYIKEFRLATPIYAYFALKNMDLHSFNAGSAVPTLNRNHVHEESVLLPPRELIQDFDRLALPMFSKKKENESQIAILEKLRDTLLPKLMNGEVRVVP